ncbi:MAG: long-chain fatty acid--CoA ligase [Bacteroidales bacterium]|jgi:long-chain acyl-CoA synthetase|nr:long-chain fatty acid--CoA ligase [Bacteroidales bacterium]
MKQHITHMLRERVTLYGERTVFKYRDKITGNYEALDWNTLLTQTNKVSGALLFFGFGYNDKIGILSVNKPEWTISDLGILAIRGIVVPIYATSSKQEIKYIVDETKMKLLFAGSYEQIKKGLWLLDQCESLEKIVVYEGMVPDNDNRFIKWNSFLDLSENDKYSEKLEQYLEEAQTDDIATIIYTSGTTGVPKGAMLGHDNIISALKINYERLDITEDDVSLCFLPLSHVFERTWTYFLLYCGATNIFLENPREVIDTLSVVKPTVMCTVPRFFEKTYEGILKEAEKWPSYKKKIFDWSIKIGHQYIEYLKNSEKVPGMLSFKQLIADKLVLKKLRLIFGGKIKALPCAGAAIDSKLLRFFHATGIFINYGYGATETTATVSCFKSDRFNFNSCGSIMPEVSLKIGAQNEILVKGNTIFKGYFNKPEETSKVLKDGWYFTGDEGYVVEDEFLVMTDRIKDLIKTSGGKYVSPQKLELLYTQDKYIEQLVIIGDNRKYISALIVPSFVNLKKQAQKFGLDPENNELLVSNIEINNFIQQRIDMYQEEFTPYEKVIKFTLLPEAFNIDKRTLTNTLKIRRNIIAEQYSDLIEKMYLSA